MREMLQLEKKTSTQNSLNQQKSQRVLLFHEKQTNYV